MHPPVLFLYPLSTAGGLDVGEELGRGVLAVALGVVVDPAPEVLARLLQRLLRLPAELLVGQRGVGREIQHITLASGNNLVGEVAADDVAKGLDHLEHGAAAAGTQVPGLDAGLVLAEVVERGQMTLGQVHDVNVVADSGAVSRGVVWSFPSIRAHTVAENEQLLAVTGCDLAKQRQQVVRDALGVLAHEAGRVGAAGVEISQESAVEVLKRLAGLLQLVALGLDVIGDDLLDKSLGVAGGEVDDTVNLGVLLEDLIEAGLVGDVNLVEVGALAAQELNAVDGDLGRVVEAVDNDNIVAVLEQREGGE
ncbi:hypothetical protein ColLi_01162 [Colletotrichum liriopes]|uniref:Uncharacterized protein n=1 Tax=Colletotrichum liriopes TaxID=708192 RepID=A0AA37LMQ3_9PEZI|nr:hypothetical protein ColLi_01162 [Colletotrichum liriopes]